MAAMAAARGARRSIIPAVKKHLAGYARAGEVQVPRCLSTASMKGYRPEDDSSLQYEGQERQGVDVRRRDFSELFNIPFYPLRGLGLGVDELFNNPFTVASRGNVDVRKPWDAVEDKDALHLRVDMPGLGKDDVRVYAEENSLVIKGEAQSDGELDGSGRKYSSRIDLPPKVYKLDQIKAQMKNGVLKVTVPKFKEEEIKNVINVNIS
ncbi:small heat shock protein, chloroplastic [Cryptomeria japonica]|uniref:small heat shock protein, chloroplastic n=1 Tax=Cryptomeria japonica TaxID=3369 RepID=UPI0027DA1AC7|nr:small heat shock protein, chloroplastic [Cryptomeria japonica]